MFVPEPLLCQDYPVAKAQDIQDTFTLYLIVVFSSSRCSYNISSQKESPHGNDKLTCCAYLELLLRLTTGTERYSIDNLTNEVKE